MTKLLKIINDWQVKGFLFDFDGTLVDTIAAYLQTYVDLFQEEFRIKIPPEQIKKHFGKPAYKIIRDVTRYRINDDEMKRLIKRREEILLSRHLNRIKLVDGIPGVLKFLKKENMKLAIVTSSTKSMLVAITARFNILKWFDAVVTADDVKRGKPDPDPFLKATKMLDLSIKSVVAVGDTVYDIISAKRAGIKIIFIQSGNNKTDNLQASEKPDLVIESFNEFI